jgi:flavodoxin
MQIVIVYDTKFGNTEKIAKAIAHGASELGTVRLMDGGQLALPFADRPDLLIIGGPTQKRGMSPGFRDVVIALARGRVDGLQAAAFDTRYRGSTWLMGSAAGEAAKHLRKAGAPLVTAPESFFIGRGGPLERQALESGEVERAEAWGRAVGASVRATQSSPKGDQP